MNYYNEIKEKLINNEITKRVKDYSKNKSDLNTYYSVGKLLKEAGKHYGEGIIKEYSIKLTKELGKKYSTTTLKRVRKFYLMIEKGAPLVHQLTWSHYVELLSLDFDQISYYINEVVKYNLSKRELRSRIKSKEYERLPEETKLKIKTEEKVEIQDLVKNPIIIKNSLNKDIISEKVLRELILEDIDSFLKELGEGFSYIGNEYKIKIGGTYNYIDIFLFNIRYNCYVVVELKITELKKEHIGQVEIYMNYVDKNIKTINQDKTIGLIIVKKDNQFILEYSSDSRIFRTTYVLGG